MHNLFIIKIYHIIPLPPQSVVAGTDAALGMRVSNLAQGITLYRVTHQVGSNLPLTLI